MKRFLPLLTLAVLIGCLTLGAHAADPGQLTLSGANAPPGGTVSLTLSMPANPGIASMSASVSWNADVLTLTGVTDAGLLGGSARGDTLPLSGYMHPADLTVFPYPLTWVNDTAAANITATGDLVTLTFAVSPNAAPGEYPVTVTLSADDTFDVNAVNVPFTVTSGAVTVDPLTLHVTNEAELIAALNRTVPVACIELAADMTLTQNCMLLLDETHILNYHNTVVIVPAGVTVTVASGGRLGVAVFSSYDYDAMHEQYPAPTATLVNEGTILVQSGGELAEEFTRNGGNVQVASGGSCVIPLENSGSVSVGSGAEFRTAQGAQCVNHGSVAVQSGAEMEARFGSTFTNAADGTLDLNGTFTVNSVHMETGDSVWFSNAGVVTGAGTILLQDAGDPPAVDLSAAAAAVQTAIAGGNTVNVTVASAAVRGDVNGDGVKNIRDAIYLAYYSLIPNIYPLDDPSPFDFNGDGAINLRDAIYLAYNVMIPNIYPLP